MDQSVLEEFFTLPVSHDRDAAWLKIREMGPVIDLGQLYIITGREAVDFALHRPDLFSTSSTYTEAMGWPVKPIPLGVDPPEHKRYRRVLDPLLAPKPMAVLGPELRRQVKEIIDGFAERDIVDVVAELAVPYPSQVFLTLFGLPLEDRDRLIAWKTAIIDASGAAAGFGASDMASSESGESPTIPAYAELMDYIQTHLEERRSRPGGEDLLSAMLALEGDDAFTDEEIHGICFLFVLAGLDTVTIEIGFALKFLAEDADLRRSVVADSTLIPAFVEEVIRLETPAPFLPRVTTEEVDVCGRMVPAGTMVAINISSANRESLEDGRSLDAIDLQHASARHWGFGGGVHRCLGSHLARLELRLVLEEFHERIHDYEIEPGFDPVVAWPAGSIHLDRLPLVIHR